MWSQSGPFWGRTFLGVAFPLVKKGVRRAYRAFPDAIDGAKDHFRRAFDETDCSPGPVAEFMNKFVGRPTFRHVLRMVREHRRRAE